jgi:hypothetical protein
MSDEVKSPQEEREGEREMVKTKIKPTPIGPDLLKMLDGLTPEQLARVREVAVASGIAPQAASPHGGEGVTLPDGRVRVTVTFDGDLGAQLKLWAEAQNEPLATFLVNALTSYVQMDWQATQAV